MHLSIIFIALSIGNLTVSGAEWRRCRRFARFFQRDMYHTATANQHQAYDEALDECIGGLGGNWSGFMRFLQYLTRPDNIQSDLLMTTG